MTFSFKSPVFILSILGIVAVLVGAIILLQYLNQPQDNRSQASVEGGSAEVSISPATMNLQPGESGLVTVSLNTKNAAISAVVVGLNYTYSGSSAPLVLSDIAINPIFAVWNCPTSSIYPDPQKKNISLSIGCLISDRYTNTAPAQFFTFKVAAPQGTASQVVTIGFSQSTTTISQGDTDADIAAIPRGTLVVSVGATAQAATTTGTTTASQTTTGATTATSGTTASTAQSTTTGTTGATTTGTTATGAGTTSSTAGGTTTTALGNVLAATNTTTTATTTGATTATTGTTSTTTSTARNNTTTSAETSTATDPAATSSATSGVTATTSSATTSASTSTASATVNTTRSTTTTASPSSLPKTGGVTQTASLVLLGILFLLGGMQLVVAEKISDKK